MGWVSPSRWLGFRERSVICLHFFFQSGGQGAPGRATTTLCNPLLLVPHKRLRSRWRQQLSTAIPGHCPLPGLAFVSCHAPQGWNRMVCPMQTKGFSSHGHLPTVPGDTLQHGQGAEAKSGFTHQMFLDALCCQESRQKQCPEDSIGWLEPLEKSGTQIAK